MAEQITQKRRNPFEKPLNQTNSQPEPVVVPEPVVETTPEPVYVPEPKAQPKKQPKPVYVAPIQSDDREKYTATMEVNLRRQIKIYCATSGMMFSEFIELACAEKLQREAKR